MLISIIIPVYNVEPYLRQCIESALLQTVVDFELLLIDDGSTDSSGAICDEYAARDTRIRVFHTPNGGVSAARNMALDRARGERVVFVDSDDWIDKDHLACFLAHDMGDSGIVFTGLVRHCTNGEMVEEIFRAREYEGRDCIDALMVLRRHDFVGWTMNKMFSRKLIEQYGLRFEVGISLREDELFTLTYYHHIDRCAFTGEATYHYRQLRSGLTMRRRHSSEILHVAALLYEAYASLSDSPENHYLATRIRLSQTCLALKAARSRKELREVHTHLLEAWREYDKYRESKFITDSRDRKVAGRSTRAFALSRGGSSLLLLRLWLKFMHV